MSRAEQDRLEWLKSARSGVTLLRKTGADTSPERGYLYALRGPRFRNGDFAIFKDC